VGTPSYSGDPSLAGTERRADLLAKVETIRNNNKETYATRVYEDVQIDALYVNRISVAASTTVYVTVSTETFVLVEADQYVNIILDTRNPIVPAGTVGPTKQFAGEVATLSVGITNTSSTDAANVQIVVI
jgi:hypothetical protein